MRPVEEQPPDRAQVRARRREVGDAALHDVEDPQGPIGGDRERRGHQRPVGVDRRHLVPQARLAPAERDERHALPDGGPLAQVGRQHERASTAGPGTDAATSDRPTGGEGRDRRPGCGRRPLPRAGDECQERNARHRTSNAPHATTTGAGAPPAAARVAVRGPVPPPNGAEGRVRPIVPHVDLRPDRVAIRLDDVVAAAARDRGAPDQRDMPAARERVHVQRGDPPLVGKEEEGTPSARAVEVGGRVRPVDVHADASTAGTRPRRTSAAAPTT